jgi:hypothetical protein
LSSLFRGFIAHILSRPKLLAGGDDLPSIDRVTAELFREAHLEFLAEDVTFFSFSSLSSVGEVGLVRVLVGVLVVGTVIKPLPGMVSTLLLSEGASEGVAVALVK